MASRVIQGFFIGGAMRPQPAPQAAAVTRPRHATGAPPPAFAGRSAPLQARMAPGRPPLAHQGAGHVAQPHGGDGSFEIDPVKVGLSRSGGKPLPPAVLAKMEAAFGEDFSSVRVHVGPQASRIGAIAFATGDDLYFAPGRYQPESMQGQQLLGHELAHVVQQRQGRVRASGAGIAVVQDRGLEAEADRLAMRAAAHRIPIQPKAAQRPSRPPAPGESRSVQPMFSAVRSWLGKTNVSAEVSAKLACAQNAINYARPLITHGPQNQQWARAEHGDEGDVNMGAMIGLMNVQWGGSGGYDGNWTKARRVGASVAATGGGNCQDIAALAYNYLREHALPHWRVYFVVAENIHHSFATIGDPQNDPAQDVVVADAWVRYPKACRFSEHFCRHDNQLTVRGGKFGGKAGRTGTLISKYWDPVPLPSWVATQKNMVRGNQRNRATWNHEYAVDTWVEPNYVYEPPDGALLPV